MNTKKSTEKPVYELNRSYDDDESDNILPDVETGNTKNPSSSLRSCTCQSSHQTWMNTYMKVLIVSLILLFIFLYILYISDLIQDRNDHTDYLLKDNFNQSNHRQLSLASIRAHKRHRHTCNDYQFGCCEIYSDCSYNKTDFTDYKVYTFRPTVHTIKHNKEGTNCPRLIDLVTGHNRHYPIHGNASCETYYQGCHHIETECDTRIRFIDVEDGLEDDIQLYKKNVHLGHKYTNLVERNGIDIKPGILKLMFEYEQDYPSRDFDYGGFLLGLCVCLAFVIFTR